MSILSEDPADYAFPYCNDTICPLGDAGSLAIILKHVFTVSEQWKQGIFSMDNGYGGKRFFGMARFAEVVQELAARCADVHLYEILGDGRPVIPYFDIEWYDAPGISPKDIIESVITFAWACLHRIGFRGLHGVAVYSASGMSKGRHKESYHILFDTTEAFKDIADHKRFIHTILYPFLHADRDRLFCVSYRDEEMRCVIDPNPYGAHQSFRLPYQSKWSVEDDSAPRPLIPRREMVESIDGLSWSDRLTIGVYDDPTTIHLITVSGGDRSTRGQKAAALTGESPEYDKVVELCRLLTVAFVTGYTSARDLVWMLWGVEQTERMRQWIHTLCGRAPNYSEQWVDDLIRGWRYAGMSIGSLIKWATACSDEARVREVLSRFHVTYEKELFEHHMEPEQKEVVCERYLPEICFDGATDTILLQSHLGTGKTHAITGLIRRSRYESILILSPRKSYTYAQHGIFAAEGALPPMQSYLDHEGDLSNYPYLILQVESLHRIGNFFEPYDLVIMDESESILNQLHSVVTNADNMINNHEVLAMAIRTARHVIMADAFLSDRTFHFARELRSGSRTLYLENQFQPYAREAVWLRRPGSGEAPFEAFCERIMTALRAGRRCMVVWTSKRCGEQFVENYLTKAEAIPYLFYNSDTGKEEQEGLRDVEVAWQGIQCLMMTTSITVGLSYHPDEEEDQFDEAFLYGCSMSALPRDVAQALLRVRVLRENRLTYVLDTTCCTDTVERGFQRVQAMLDAKEQKQVREHPLARWMMAPKWVKWNHAYNENEARISRAEYRAVMEAYLMRSGYRLHVEAVADAVAEEEEKRPTEEVALVTAATPIVTDASHIPDWSALPALCTSDADRIRSAICRGEATAEEKLAYRAFVFRCHFVTGLSEDELGAMWERFARRDRMDAFWNVVAERRWSLIELSRIEARKRYAIMSTDRLRRRATMDRFLEVLGMEHSQQEVILSTERLLELAPQLEGAERELREGLGLRASQRRKEWSMKNTMDLIRVVMEEWGCGTVETVKSRPRMNNRAIQYNLHLNKYNTLWNKLSNAPINYDRLLIKF